jgi:predicted Zn-ribbon and HTH transcriptional regulator
MPRPPIEVADIIRAAGESFFEDSRKWLTWLHLKVLNAILRCRTATLGGHVDACSKCGHQAISFNSCRNRHCPKCQANARDRWLQARGKELLPTRYVHVVFTLPRQLSPLALQNKREIYSLLFQASAETLLQVARDPKHLGAEIGFFSVLHTWNQKLQHHPHVHCVVPAGGLAPDHSHWIDSQQRFFLPVEVLGEVFRAKFVDGLKAPSTSSVSTEPSPRYRIRRPSPPGFARCSAPSGWFIQNVPSAARNMPFATLANTLIGWRSRTIDWSHSPTVWSRSAGATPPTRTRSV